MEARITSRTECAKRNIIYGYVSNIVITLFSFINRTIFIYTLGVNFLGVTGLFTNILGILSFSELGIGTAMTFCLYEPIADNNKEKIKSIMQLYQFAYRIIACIVGGLGILLFWFIPYLVNVEVNIGNIQIYYLLYLINTVSTYFVSYKYSFVEANQKSYVITNANTIGSVAIYVCQLVILLCYKNFLLYLIIQVSFGIIQKLVISNYLNRKYPFLNEKNIEKIDSESFKEIKISVKAMVIDKIGSTLIYQTDNILISAFISTAAVGYMSNYILLESTVSKFTLIIFSSCVAGIGNIFAVGGRDTVKVFNTYNFVGFWINGFVMVAFITLVQPFIILWIGKDMLVDNFTIVLYFISIYLFGQSSVIINFRTACGLFKEDKWISSIQAVVNLIVSVVALSWLGLPGVYIGTIVARVVELVIRPNILFKRKLNISPAVYYFNLVKYLVAVVIPIIALKCISELIMGEVTIIRFGIMVILTIIVPNVFWCFTYRKTEELQWLVGKVKALIKRA